MRSIFPCLLVFLASGAQVFADSPAERIKDLYNAVPYDLVRASPQVDILTHIDVMRERRHPDTDDFAVPDLDMEIVLRDSGPDDVLMNPAVLEAIAKMPSERAAQVLRMIEDRRAGLDPLQDIPSLSMSEDSDPPESLSLRGWRLDRDANGAPVLQNGQDVTSRVLLVPSMILANFGRVSSIQDDTEGFRITLENGDILEGEIAQESLTSGFGDQNILSAGDMADQNEGPMPPVVEGGAAVRPGAGPAPSEVTTGSPPENVVPPVISLRPKLRPLGLGGPT